MQPYQKAAEALRSGEEYPLHVLKNAGLTALGGGAANIGAKAVGRIIPAVGALINKYVPDNIMQAGLKKINPKFATFMEGAMQAGYTTDDMRAYLAEKVEKSQEPDKQQKNIIEQEDSNLHLFMDQEIKRGRKPIEAAAIAQNDKKFSAIISKLIKAHKTPWSQIVESVYGKGDMAPSSPQQQPMNMRLSPSGFPQGNAPGAQQQGSQAGPGSQKLMAALSEVNQILGQQ